MAITFHTQAEAARMLGISRATMKYWVKTGKIEYKLNHNNGVRISNVEIEKHKIDRKQDFMAGLISLGFTMRDLATLAEMIEAKQ